MNHPPRPVLLGLILFLLMIPPAFGAEEKIIKAPNFPKEGVWINHPGITKKDYKDKITLVYFWDYTSINCIREIGVIKNWYAKYSAFGLQMIWVHAPEFKFAQDEANVKAALERMDIPYPVFLDNDFKLWEAYKNQSWPTKHLLNEKGEIVFTQVGEEGYLATEENIRLGLQSRIAHTELPERLIHREMDKFSTEQCGYMTTETYTGYKRSNWWGGEVANRKWLTPDETIMFIDRGERVQRGFFIEGLWTNREDDMMHARDTNQADDYLGMIYVSSEVYVVASRAVKTAEPVRVYVTRDDLPLPLENRGVDIREDEFTRTYFELNDARLYFLIAKDDQEPHEIKFWTKDFGVSIHSFSFSNNCLSQFEHLA